MADTSRASGPLGSTARTHIACTDNFNRVRSVGLWISPNGRVVLVAPPAETALLTPAQVRALRDRLDELATLAERQPVPTRPNVVRALPRRPMPIGLRRGGLL